MLKRCWTEIDLGRIKENYRVYSSLIAKDKRVMAVVKADAYGHGDAEVAALLQEQGVTDFAVSNINEARNLREAGITGRILILGYTPTAEADALRELDITQALISEDYAEALAATGVRVKAQFAIDTGMNRIGLDGDDPALCEKAIRKYAGKFLLDGLFTHLCVADTPSEDDFTDGQIKKFKAVCERVADMKLPCLHCLNSAGGLWHGEFGDLARLGIILYGLKPDYANTLPDGIKPALCWKTVVSMVKTVHAGETVGYGRTYTATKDTVIATLPTGYADGYFRSLSGRGCVIINGKKAPIVGRVCMDQMTVDVTGIENIHPGDEVILIGDGYTADDMAKDAGTIGYEIVCGISKRVERIYKER